MTVNPKFKRNLLRIIPFGILWGFIFGGFILNDLTLNRNQSIDTDVDILLTPAAILFSFILSIFVGLVVGFFEVVVLERRFRKYSFGATVMLKLGLYLCIFVFVIFLFYPLAAGIESGLSINHPIIWKRFGRFLWSLSFWNTLIQLGFALFLSVLYSAVSENLGFSVLRNLFLGSYHKPIVEKRIFMFLDMKDSTEIAELLGHEKYFELLSDYYDAMADAIIQYKGEVYQYIGDEVVVTWKAADGIQNANCLRTFFAISKQLDREQERFIQAYGKLPGFKAGIHIGEVTTGEMGALKREIVFTGDVLNTAARFQGLCNAYNQDLIASQELISQIKEDELFYKTLLGEQTLRGKSNPIAFFGIRRSK